MMNLYFMDQEFSAAPFNEIGGAAICEIPEVELNDSWEWFYDFFFHSQPGGWGSEESASLRSHLLNMAAIFYKNHDAFVKKAGVNETVLQAAIKDLLEMVEASKGHLICFWTFGDESDKKALMRSVQRCLPRNKWHKFCICLMWNIECGGSCQNTFRLMKKQP